KRRSKEIGKSLEAVVVIRTNNEAELKLADWGEDLREILNVSRLEFLRGDVANDLKINEQSVEVGDSEGVYVFASKTYGLEKCGRCWHWEGDIGSHSNHPTLCSRCVDAVEQNTGEVVA
ncbi:isoleucine--tRNA ligase, partial [bacterium]|nr:isoleucine--tRNA ligase [bacterium]